MRFPCRVLPIGLLVPMIAACVSDKETTGTPSEQDNAALLQTVTMLQLVDGGVMQSISDRSFTNTSPPPNKVPWTPEPDGVWGDANHVHYPGELVSGSECRGAMGQCIKLRANPTADDGESCVDSQGDDKPGCRESIRQNFPAIDTRRLTKVSFHGKRGSAHATGWNIIVVVFGNTSDINSCNGPQLKVPPSTDYGELSLTSAELINLSDDCFSSTGSFIIRGLALTKAGIAGRTVFIDDVEVEWVAPLGLYAPLGPLVPDGQEPPLPDRAFNQGSTLPLKLRVLDSRGTEITDAEPRLVSVTRTRDPVPVDIKALTNGNANEDTSFRYSDGMWIYNFATGHLETGTYQAVIEIRPAGDRHVASFVLR